MVDRFGKAFVGHVNRKLPKDVEPFKLFELKETCNYRLQGYENDFNQLFFTSDNKLTKYVKERLGYTSVDNIPFLKSRLLTGTKLVGNCYLWVQIQWLAQLCNPHLSNSTVSKYLSEWAGSNPLEVIDIFQHLYMIAKFS